MTGESVNMGQSSGASWGPDHCLGDCGRIAPILALALGGAALHNWRGFDIAIGGDPISGEFFIVFIKNINFQILSSIPITHLCHLSTI